MSDTAPPKTPPDHDVDKLVKENPGVDAAQVREAQKLLEELRREGVSGPSYGISSPYERRPVRKRD
jgi:hypothetical protein